jgi:hypothetical protein
MKPSVYPLAILGFAFLSFSVFSDRFAALLKLEGMWTMKTKKGLIYEHWKKVSDTELKSRSFKLNGKDTVFLERVQLIEKEDGIFYIPVVQDQNDGKPVPFKLVSSEQSRFVFENKLHDFPQRIIYHIVTVDSIVARVEGQQNGRVDGSDFYYTRMK